MKRFLVLCLCLWAAVAVVASAEASITLSANKTGDTVTLEAVAKELEISAFVFALDYDKEALTPVSYTFHEKVKTGLYSSNLDEAEAEAPEQITFVFVKLSNCSFQDEAIFTVQFAVKDPSVKTLPFSLSYIPENVIYHDENGNLLNAVFTVQNAVWEAEPDQDKPSNGGSRGTAGGGPKGTTEESPVEKTQVPDADATPDPPETDGIDRTEKTPMFTDMAAHAWAQDAVERLFQKGVIKGISETQFGPAAAIRRADFLLLYMRMIGEIAPADDNFDDCLPNAYYYDAVGTAKQKGYTGGVGNNLFLPDNSVTRQDMFVMTYRILRQAGKIQEAEGTEALTVFTDFDQIAEYARPALAALYQAGYIKGNDGKIDPTANTTRAETAVFLDRLP